MNPSTYQKRGKIEMVNKQNLKNFFRDLRKEGFFARMNFMCCNTCAWAEVPEDKENVVFYHNQENPEDEYLYLCWSGDARIIFDIAENNNFDMIWNGNQDVKIKLRDKA